MLYSDFRGKNDILRNNGVAGCRILKISTKNNLCIVSINHKTYKVTIKELIEAVNSNKLYITNISLLKRWRGWGTQESNSNIENKIKDYTGEKLKAFVDSLLIGRNKCRDFVYKLINYNSRLHKRIFAISGLRGVGKTTGLAQYIRKLNDYNNIVYITLIPGEEIDFSDLYEYIKKKYENKQYIIIDEVTFTNNFTKTCAILCDDFVSNGKTVIVSGTDSLALVLAAYDSAFHRVYYENVTFINYIEALRTGMISNFNEYLSIGGLYDSDKITDLEKLDLYINTAIVDNIMNTIYRNENVISYLGFNQLVDKDNIHKNEIKDKVKTIIYMILVAISISIFKKEKSFNINYIIEQFYEYKENRGKMLDVVDNTFKINSKQKIKGNELKVILDILEKINVVIKIENMDEPGTFKYYITNQSMFNIITTKIFNVLRAAGFIFNVNSDKKVNLNKKAGELFESCILNHAFNYAYINRYNIYYYNDGRREIDLILGNTTYTDDGETEVYVYYEIKKSNKAQTAVISTHWLTEVNKGDTGVISRKIVYGGKDEIIFNKFNDTEINSETREDTKQGMIYANENLSGIKLIPVESFLYDISKYTDF